jgi:hypothetical protein
MKNIFLMATLLVASVSSVEAESTTATVEVASTPVVEVEKYSLDEWDEQDTHLFQRSYELEPILITYRPKDSILTHSSDINLMESRNVQLQMTTPGFKQPVLKGLQGDKILLTIDGLDFTNSLFRSGPNQYYSFIPDEFITNSYTDNEFNSISNNSLGGSVNRSLGISESMFSADLDTLNAENLSGKRTLLYKEDNLSLGITYNSIQGIEDVPHSNYNQKAGYIEYDGFKFIHSRSDDIDRTDKFEQGKVYIYEEQYFTGVYKSFNIDNYNLNLSYNNFSEKINKDGEYVETSNDMYQVSNNYYWKGLEVGTKHKLEVIDYDNKGKVSDYDVISNSINASYRSYWKNLDYSIFALYDYTMVDGSGFNVIDRDFDAFSMGTKVEYYDVYASVTQGFKYPTIPNLVEGVTDSATEIPNRNLGKEKSIKYVLGYKTEVNEYFSLNTSLFYTDLTDMIVRVKSGDKFKIDNADSGYIQGANINMIFNYEDVVLDVFTEYLYGETDLDYISKLTPLRIDTRLEYKDFYSTFKWAMKAHNLPEKDISDIRIATHNNGYSQLDLGYNYSPIKNHNFNIELRNITNNKGRLLGSSIDFNDRNIYVKYELRF